MNTVRKTFIKGISIQVSPEMIAAMGTNPVTDMTETIRSLAAAIGQDKVDQIGEHFRYRSVGGDIVVDLSLEASKNLATGLSLTLVPALIRATEEMTDIAEAFASGKIDASAKQEAMHQLCANTVTVLMGDPPKHYADMVPTMPAQLYAH